MFKSKIPPRLTGCRGDAVHSRQGQLIGGPPPSSQTWCLRP